MPGNARGDHNSQKEQIENIKRRHERIRALNDQFRKTGQGGRYMITRGIQALGPGAVLELLQRIAAFDGFDADNDPHREHDFGSLSLEDEQVFWKIDYYDASLTGGSPDPADPEVTVRVLTIMLASEY